MTTQSAATTDLEVLDGDMKHLGDITKLNGYEIEPVDVVCGGSPCTNLSQAGNRAGLAGKESGLFLHQIRIIKELREHDKRNGRPDELVRPRYMVWENVPGAFSTTNGGDFKRVLEETVRIVEPDAPDLPMPKSWSKSGCLSDKMGRWSIAWRVHDAQFWGVPQRRKRIALVADFGGLSAPEVLFERKGMLWNPTEDEEQGKRATRCTEKSIGEADSATLQIRSGCPEGGGKGALIQVEKSATLSSIQQTLFQHEPRVFAISSQASNAMNSGNPHSGIYEAETTRTLDLNGGNPCCNQGGMCVVEGAVSYGIDRAAFNQGMNAQYKPQIDVEKEGSLVARGPGAVAHPIYSTSKADYQTKVSEDVAGALVATDYKDPPTVAYSTSKTGHQTRFSEELAWTLEGTDYKDPPTAWAPPDYIVRRLTPLECERLQGYPDGWTLIGTPKQKEVADYDIEYDEEFNVVSRTKTGTHTETVYTYESNGKTKEVTDSARYKALGNSIALPFWKVLARRISAQYDRDITMGSLFDGIGGFPLAFEHCGGKAVWASEVEEFCIAVTKERFPEHGD